MQECHVAVIGASAAGLFAAYLLAQGGYQVALFERREALGLPRRTLIVTDQIRQVLGFTPGEAVVNHVSQIELLSSKRRVVVKLRAPDMVLERERLIQLLADRAQGAGVDIELGHTFLGLEEGRDHLSLALYEGASDRAREVKARGLVGADGVRSRVARLPGKADRRRAAICQARVALPPHTDEHTVRVWFHKESTPYFCWLIPESKHTAAVGLVGEHQEQARDSLQRFMDVCGFEALSIEAADVALYHPQRKTRIRLKGGEVFLIGDAGGQVKSTTVGGVVTGLRGARAAAGVLLSNKMGKESRALKKELDLHYLIRFFLNRFSDSDYDDLLGMVGSRTRDVLQTYGRDQFLGAFFRLLLAQPRFLCLAARSLMRVSGGQLPG